MQSYSHKNPIKMRILFMFDGLGRGGRERRFAQLVKGLNRAGFTDLFLINTRNIIEYNEILNYNIHIEFIDRKINGGFFPILKRINEIKPDIIQPWTDINAAILDIAYPFLKKRPIYISSFIADCNYNKHPLWSKIAMRIAYYLSTYIVSNSWAGFNNYKVKGKKCYCIHNGFDFDRLKTKPNESIKNELNIKTRYTISMIARMKDNKDFSMYIKAAHSILKQRNDITFLAVGSGPMEQEWKKEVPEQFKDKIIFTGQRNDVDDILRITDISILCTNSETHGEGISNTILESMAFGIPVIATIGGGTAEIVKDKETGILIPPKDYKALSHEILYLLDNETQRKQLSEAAQKRAIIDFSLESMTLQYIFIYTSCSIPQ